MVLALHQIILPSSSARPSLLSLSPGVSRSAYSLGLRLTIAERNELAHMIRGARARLRTTPSEERALRPTDVPGTLLNLALLNLSASDEILRLGAHNLINEVARFFHFEISSILSVKGPSIQSCDIRIHH